MKNWVRVLALSLALVMVLGVSAAFADAYTIPKTLKNVEGLPENPEVPEMTTKNDGKTETVTVNGQLASLSAVWGDGTIPLTLTDGSVTFDITGHDVQLGMEGKFAWVDPSQEKIVKAVTWVDDPQYDYDVTKNADGSFTVEEEYSAGDYEKDYYYGETFGDTNIKIPSKMTTEKYVYSNGGAHVFKEPYVGVKYPGYYYTVPTGEYNHYDEKYYVPYQVKTEDGTIIQVRDWETGKVLKFDENGNYYIALREAYDWPIRVEKYVESMTEDENLVKAIEEEQKAAIVAAGLDPDDYYFYCDYDGEGYTVGMYNVRAVFFWAADINGYGKAFEGKTADGVTVGYNRKGAACEKTIEMPAGTDFFSSETAPSKVTVTWQSGKNMYNNTVWYISKIAQEYADQTVTASFGQGGQWNGIKKEAKAQ